ncbi:CLUMA_CG007251, isoform A [Clunio marinus]|uniref:CLUMA_CG007251, isoform A n=1 Tax=Clunio marinus TaxID=568069 RepID=A0A1J1I0K0_9DIPT|nr:CLUMA_CG007251, isoform A [Clunio marinus]
MALVRLEASSKNHKHYSNMRHSKAIIYTICFQLIVLSYTGTGDETSVIMFGINYPFAFAENFFP